MRAKAEHGSDYSCLRSLQTNSKSSNGQVLRRILRVWISLIRHLHLSGYRTRLSETLILHVLNGGSRCRGNAEVGLAKTGPSKAQPDPLRGSLGERPAEDPMSETGLAVTSDRPIRRFKSCPRHHERNLCAGYSGPSILVRQHPLTGLYRL